MIHGVQPFGRHVNYDKLKLRLVDEQRFCHANPSHATREEHFLELRLRIFSMLG